jgi:hypothetical protein
MVSRESIKRYEFLIKVWMEVYTDIVISRLTKVIKGKTNPIDNL